MLSIALALAMLAPAQAQAEPLIPGTVSVELADSTLPSETDQIFAEAVANALAQADFIPLPSPGKGRYIAQVQVKRTERGLVASRATSAGPSTALGNWGAAVEVALPTKNTQLRPLVVTELRVRILRRDNRRAVWGGQALTAQAEGTAADDPATVANKLAQAIARRFPKPASETIAVP